MAENSHLYQYAPLEGPNSFRILELLPGEIHETPRCNIVHVSMDEKPQYEALSYVWSLGKATIYCGSSNVTFRVSVTCIRALKYLRLRDKSRSLWIDAICINQEDSPAAIEEKDQQVKMMHKIYENASRVLIYPMGLHKLQQEDIGTLLGFVNLGRDERDQEKIPIPQQYQGFESPRYGDKEIQFIARRMEWFSRTWVIQEAALADEAIMVLGKVEVPLQEFIDLSLEAIDSRDELRDQLSLHASLRKPSTPRPSLLRLAYSSRCTKATRPQDKLFALVGIASDGDSFQSAISYGKDPATVFADFSQRCINQSRNLDLLSVVRESPPSQVSPSWAVQWDSMDIDYLSVLDPLGSRRNFKACGDFTSTERQDRDTHELHLRGIKFDSVRAKSWFKMVGTSTSELVGALRRLSFPCLKGETRQGPKSQAQTSVVYNDIENAIYSTISCRVQDMSKQRDEPDWVHIDRRSRNYDFVKTSRGYIGLIDKSVSKGDLICLLSGGSVPYVLRPVPGEEGKFQFIGEAYIEGIMYGEAMEGKEERDLQDFCLV
ncbi:heterokaryon incompatibility protein-domain-containing protein [Phyllosticta capitalensis]